MGRMKWWRLATLLTITLGLYGCPPEEAGEDSVADAGAMGGAGGAAGGAGGGAGGAGGEAGMGGAGAEGGAGGAGAQGGAGGGIGGQGGEGGAGGQGGEGGAGGQGGEGGAGGQGGAGGGQGGAGGDVMCDEVLCDLACDHGFATDENGCEICECLPAPPMCRADEDCPQPGAPNCNAFCVEGQCQVRCEDPPPMCPDPEDPNVDYVFDNPEECAEVAIRCAPGSVGFNDECGCGCIREPNACEPVLCDLFCEFGFQRDENGCEICACNEPPNRCRADADCPVPPLPGCSAACVDGICQLDCEEPICPDPNDPGVRYVADSPEECARVRFACDEGEMMFNDECGCGCIAEDDLMCPDPRDPSVEYVSQDPDFCARARFVCEEGQEAFNNECGCGCIGDAPCICPDIFAPVCGADGNTYPNACQAGCAGVPVVADGECGEPEPCICPAIFAPVCGADGETYGNACEARCAMVEVVAEGPCPVDPICPDPNDPAVNYVSQDPERCAVIRFVCEPGQEAFSNACGCGCIGEAGPVCEPIRCDLACEFGFQQDENGCDVCACNPEPARCEANDDCPQPVDPNCAGVCQRGQCQVICLPPEECICPAVFDPVCGADGNTYPNACRARCAEVEVDYDGECRDPGECICPAVIDPVCGADGNTYQNACRARCAQVDVVAPGECEPMACEDGQIMVEGRCETLCYGNQECARGQQCNAADVCLPDPNCPMCAVCAGWCVGLEQR